MSGWARERANAGNSPRLRFASPSSGGAAGARRDDESRQSLNERMLYALGRESKEEEEEEAKEKVKEEATEEDEAGTDVRVADAHGLAISVASF